MYLLVPRFVLDFHFCQINEFLQHYLAVPVGIKSIESRVEDVEGELMVGFDEFEVIAKLFPCDFIIKILIVSMLKEKLDILERDFGIRLKYKKK
jgi:hypothetical protein